jgi:hypothetical protein
VIGTSVAQRSSRQPLAALAAISGDQSAGVEHGRPDRG